jgi:hypothetical protein
LAEQEAIVPVSGSNNLAVVRGEEIRLKIKGSKEVIFGVGEWDSSGPGNKI